ncbi:MAG: hypothetical protein FWC96_07155 [Oscillospiraceae bacterium]|nr:hypothetical protein [Oscillospiraceae bacterium]
MMSNSPEFWQALDKLIAETEIIIDRPAGILIRREDTSAENTDNCGF